MKTRLLMRWRGLFRILLFLLSFVSQGLIAQDLEIVNLRVGQGDATLIQGPVDENGDRINVLVDAGNISGVDGGNILSAVLGKRGIRKLDFVIVTHYDVDHIGGIITEGIHGNSFLMGFNKLAGGDGDDDGDGSTNWIIVNVNGRDIIMPDPEEIGLGDDLPVGHFVDRGDEDPPTSLAYQKYRFTAMAKGNRISLNTMEDVLNFEIDLGNGAVMTALAANGFVRDRIGRVKNINTENERSLSFLLTYKDFDFLISGDLIGQKHGAENAKVEAAVGEYISRRNIIVDVLHVNHHGANNGSDEEFLKAIKPTIAIISAGNGNPYKHPHRRALKRLEEALVYRIVQTSWGTTEAKMPDEVREIQAIYQSDVIITTNGETFTLSTERRFRVDDNPRRSN